MSNTKQNTQEETKKNPKETLQDKGKKAAKAYLKQRGYEVLDVDYESKFGNIDFVSKQDDVLVFTNLEILGPDHDGFPEDSFGGSTRGKLECIMADYLQNHDYVDMSVRFDAMKLLVLGDDKAFVRYHVNALGVNDPTYDKPQKKPTKERVSERAKSASEVSKADKNLDKKIDTPQK